MALYQALSVKTGIVSQIGSDTLTITSLDRSSAGELVLGGTNSTTVSLGKDNATTTLNLGTGTGLTTVSFATGASVSSLNIGTNLAASGAINIGTSAGATTNLYLGSATSTVTVNGNLSVSGTETVVGTTEFTDTVTFKGPVIFGDNTGGNDTVSFNTNTTIISSMAFGTGSKTISISGTAGGSLSLAAEAGGAGTGGSVFLTPGTGTTANGSVVFGNSGGTAATDFQILADTNDVTAEAGIRYNASTDIWELRSDAGTWTAISSGQSLPAGTSGHLLQYNGSAWASTATSALYGQSYTFATAAGDNQYSMTIAAQDGSTGAGGATTVRAGNGTGATAGGLLTLQGGGTATGVAGNVSITGGTASGAGTGGDVVIRGGGGSTATGNVTIGDTNTAQLTLGPTNVSFASATRVVSDIVFSGAAARSIYLAAGAGAGATFSLVGAAGAAGGNAGGALTLTGGAGTNDSNGGSITLAGGASAGAGAGGNITLNGGGHTGGTAGNVYLGASNTASVFFGAGTNGVQYDSANERLQAIGTGSINIDTTNSRLEINGSAVVHNAAMTATNFATLFNGGDASALHVHVGTAAAYVDVTAAVDGATVNDVVFIGASDTITAAQANALNTSRALGVKSAAGNVRVSGVATVGIEGTLVVAAGDDLYLSTTSAGKVTNVVPASGYITYVGQAKTGATGPATCSMYVRCERPIAL